MVKDKLSVVTDLQLKADLLELGKEIDRLVSIPKKPRACKYCGIELPARLGIGVKAQYCSQWCIEQKNQLTSKRFSVKCKIEGCNHHHYGLGYCRVHHDRFKRRGDPLYTSKGNKRERERELKRQNKIIKKCSIDGCEKLHHAKTYCISHYAKLITQKK